MPQSNQLEELVEITRQMESMRKYLDSIPEDQEFDEQTQSDLDNCRIECTQLKLAIEAILGLE